MYRYPGKPFYIPNPTYNKVKAKEVETDLLDAEEIEVDGFVVDNITTTNLISTNNTLTNIDSVDIQTERLEATTKVTTPTLYVKRIYGEWPGDILMLSTRVRSDLTIHAVGNLSTSSDLQVVGNAQFLIDAHIYGDLRVDNDLNVLNHTDTKTLAITENATVGIDLGVTNHTTTKTLAVAESATVGIDLNVANNIWTKTLVVNEEAMVNTNLIVGSNILTASLNAVNDVAVGNNLVVVHDITGENLIATSNISSYSATISYATIGNQLNTLYVYTTTLRVLEESLLSGDVTMSQKLYVTDDARCYNDLRVDSDLVVMVDATIARDLRVSRYCYLNNTLYMDGNILDEGSHLIKMTQAEFEDHLLIGHYSTPSITFLYSKYKIYPAQIYYSSKILSIYIENEFDFPGPNSTRVVKSSNETRYLKYESYPFYETGQFRFENVFSHSDYTGNYYDDYCTYAAGPIDLQQVNIYEQSTIYNADIYEHAHSALRQCYWAHAASYPKLLLASTSNPGACAYSLTEAGFKVFGVNDTSPWTSGEDLLLRFFVSDGGSICHPRRQTGTGTDLEISTSGYVVRNTSSRACKREFQEEMDNYGDWILDLPLLTFQFKPGIVEKEEEGTRYFGPMAEDIYELHPSAAVFNNEENKVEGIYSPELRHAMLAVIQKQAKQINDLTTRLEKLEAIIMSYPLTGK